MDKQELLNQRLTDCDLSVRALCFLKRADIETVRDLVQHSKQDILTRYKFGKKVTTELDDFLIKNGLHWGMADSILSNPCNSNKNLQESASEKEIIRAEIERWKAQWQLGNSSEAKYRREMLDEILSFIDSMQEKPVSENDATSASETKEINLYAVSMESWNSPAYVAAEDQKQAIDKVLLYYEDVDRSKMSVKYIDAIII